jgi:hypothetical protein
MLQLPDAHERSEMQIRSIQLVWGNYNGSLLGISVGILGATLHWAKNSGPLRYMLSGATVCKIRGPSVLYDPNISLFRRVHPQGPRGVVGRKSINIHTGFFL